MPEIDQETTVHSSLTNVPWRGSGSLLSRHGQTTREESVARHVAESHPPKHRHAVASPVRENSWVKYHNHAATQAGSS